MKSQKELLLQLEYLTEDSYKRCAEILKITGQSIQISHTKLLEDKKFREDLRVSLDASISALNLIGDLK